MLKSWAENDKSLNFSFFVNFLQLFMTSCMTQVLIRNADVNERTSRRGQFEPCLPPIQTGVRGREVLLSIDYSPLE